MLSTADVIASPPKTSPPTCMSPTIALVTMVLEVQGRAAGERSWSRDCLISARQFTYLLERPSLSCWLRAWCEQTRAPIGVPYCCIHGLVAGVHLDDGSLSRYAKNPLFRDAAEDSVAQGDEACGDPADSTISSHKNWLSP